MTYKLGLTLPCPLTPPDPQMCAWDRGNAVTQGRAITTNHAKVNFQFKYRILLDLQTCRHKRR